MNRLAARIVLAITIAAGAIAQSPERIPRDLKGRITGAAEGRRVLVTLWHNDMQRDVLEPLAEGFAAADGTFASAGVSWFERQDWGFHKVLMVARAGDRVGIRELRGDTVAIDALDLEIEPSIEIRGVLRDDATGKPIASAFVWPAIFKANAADWPEVWLTEPLLPWHTHTDAEGRFVLSGLPDFATIKLRAGGEEHALTWVDVDVDDRTEVEAWLPRGGRISGRVLLPDGKPAVRVPVTATGQGIGYGRTLTDDQGHFLLTALQADLYKVFAAAPDLTVIAVLGLRVEAGQLVEDQIVQFVRGGFIVGRIIDAETGKPFVPGPSTDVAMYGPARGRGGSCECTPVLQDGTFRIRAPAGKNHIYLRSAIGYSEPSEDVDVVEGKETLVEWKVQKGRPRKQ